MSNASGDWSTGVGTDPGSRLFERLPDAYLIVHGDGTVMYANAAWRALFGGEAASADQQGDLADQQRNCDQLIANLTANLRVGQRRASPVFRLDRHLVSGQGNEPLPRYWQIHASLIPAEPGLAAQIALRFEDVTARTLAGEGERRERAQMRSYARLRQILVQETQQRLEDHVSQFEQALAFAGVGAWEVDLRTGVVTCSDRCLRDLGATRASDLTLETFLGDDPEQISANRRDLDAGLTFEFEHKVREESGHRWVLIRGSARVHDDGAARSPMGFTLDITERMDREIHATAVAGVERSGRERSDALARTMDEFVAAVSHELRSPLNAIISWAELLQLVADPAHVLKAGEAIRRNGRQLSRMVDDLLDSGAVVSGKLSVNLKPVDLGPLVAIVVEDMRKLGEHKGLDLRLAEIGSCIVLADENRLGQVVSNLLANAIKFTDAGSVEVSMHVHGEYAEIEVRDTGRGIEADALLHVFERFQQVAPRTSGRVGGLGLGLWLATQIVDLHGGTIAARSDGPGHGATFTVRLPLESALGG